MMMPALRWSPVSLYPREVVDAVNGLLYSDLPASTVWEDVKVILRDAGAFPMYTIDKLNVDELMVHKSRHYMEAHTAHAIGHDIFVTGKLCASDRFRESVATELCPVGVLRSDQLEWNAEQLQMEGHLLPSPLGSERYCAITSVHTTQFLKALKAGCRTMMRELQDENGRLNTEVFHRQNPDLKGIIEQGWTWLILPWQVVAAFPALPRIIRRASNQNDAEARVADMARELGTTLDGSRYPEVRLEACMVPRRWALDDGIPHALEWKSELSRQTIQCIMGGSREVNTNFKGRSNMRFLVDGVVEGAPAPLIRLDHKLNKHSMLLRPIGSITVQIHKSLVPMGTEVKCSLLSTLEVYRTRIESGETLRGLELRDAVHRKIVTMNKGTCFTQVLLLDGKQILRGNAHVQPLGAPSSSSRKKAKVAKDSEKITKYFKPT